MQVLFKKILVSVQPAWDVGCAGYSGYSAGQITKPNNPESDLLVRNRQYIYDVTTDRRRGG